MITYMTLSIPHPHHRQDMIPQGEITKVEEVVVKDLGHLMTGNYMRFIPCDP
jgi:hypothetical protein